MGGASLKATIPRAVQLVVDDVGWREGWSLADRGGPWRAGVDRLLEGRDYEALAEIGRLAGMRPQAALILCEWDRENTCALCPTATPEGTEWDNSARVGPWAEEAADIFRTRAADMELTLHGVGHEHWEDGRRTRAEWHDGERNKKWPTDHITNHLATFERLLDQYDLGPAAGHSFPKSAVPCAFKYRFDATDPESTGALFHSAGVRFVSTVFNGGFSSHSPVHAPDGALEHGTLVIDRGNSGVPWYAFSTLPDRPTPNAICGIHWPNLLAPDPVDNTQVVNEWVTYLESVAEQPEVMLAANSWECATQWVYRTFLRLTTEGDRLILDGRAVPDEMLTFVRNDPVWVRLWLRPGEHIATADGEGLDPVAYARENQSALLGIKGIAGGRGALTVTKGPSPLSPLPLRHGTGVLKDWRTTLDAGEMQLEVYGRQEIRIRTDRAIHAVTSINPRVRVEAVRRVGDGFIVQVRGTDIQGDETTLQLRMA